MGTGWAGLKIYWSRKQTVFGRFEDEDTRIQQLLENVGGYPTLALKSYNMFLKKQLMCKHLSLFVFL